MSPSATNDINDQKIVSDISLPDEIPESAQTAARVPGDQLFSLKDQTILITGAGRGLGIELALGVVENGGHVAALDILDTPSEEWAHLQKTAKQKNVTVAYRKADITDEEDFKAAVDEISSRGRELGAPLHGAIACAGIQQKIPTLEYPVADFERMLRVNTVGTSSLSLLSFPIIRKSLLHRILQDHSSQPKQWQMTWWRTRSKEASSLLLQCRAA